MTILLIYTGGTIGMVHDADSGSYIPFDFENLQAQLPELNQLDCELEVTSYEPSIDSSNMHPKVWVQLGQTIEENYAKYDGFVVLHGSDTMAYTSSALSFILENLNKPVILTGSQLPSGVPRTDAKENLITAIEIAASQRNGKPEVPEVAVYFEYQLYRGNRTHKVNAEHFEAFESVNYPALAEAGVHIKFNRRYTQNITDDELIVAACDLDWCERYKGTLFNFDRYRRPEVYTRITEQRGTVISPANQAAMKGKRRD